MSPWRPVGILAAVVVTCCYVRSGVRMMLISDLDKFVTLGVPAGYTADRRTFWAPIDNVHGALKTVIASAKQSVILSMYGFDDDELAGIIAGHLDNPDVYCQISFDRSQAAGVHERLLLARWKAEYESNSVAVGTSEKGAIAHRKVLIIEED